MVLILLNQGTNEINDNSNSRQEAGAKIINMVFANVAVAA